MTTTWHTVTANKRTVEPADGKIRVWIRNGNGRAPRRARWDGTAREWWWKSATRDWRASWACYPEWCEWNSYVPESARQMGLGL